MVAVTFLLLPAAFTMAPVSATTLTFVAITWPKVTLAEAFRRTLLLVAVMLAVPSMVKSPPSASTLTVPVEVVLTSAPAAKLMPLCALRVMWPVLLKMSVLTIKLPAFTSTSTEPVPCALTAVPARPAPAALAVPSFSVTVPPATSTIWPLLPVTKSDCAASLTVLVVAVLLNSVTLTVTVSTLSALSSVR